MTKDSGKPQETVRDLLLPGVLTVLCLLLLVPIFIRMPVTNDAVLYDLEARWLGDGIIPYKDYVEVNFPGVLLVHYGTRLSLGDSDEALKFVDLLVYSLILTSALAIAKFISKSRTAVLWGLFTATLFYLSLSEWCHCQRDTWLLLPAMIGCFLRIRQVKKILEQDDVTSIAYAFLEGLIWGCGIWLKPHLLVMCVIVWGLSLFMIEGLNRKSIDAFGLLIGGLLVGGVGIWTLQEVGAWDAFTVSLTEWSPRYLEARFENWTVPRYIKMVYLFAPWHLLHIISIPIAIHSLYVFISKERHLVSFAQSILAAIYLVWLLQSHLLQHLFDYVHVPALFLAIILLTANSRKYSFLRSKSLLLAFFLVATITSPLLQLQTMKHWPTALQRDLTPAQTDQIAQLPNPNFEDLEKVEQYLIDQNVEETDVLMYNSDLVTIYWDLNLKTPTPYIYFFEIQHYFPDRKKLFTDAIEAGTQKFIVTDLVSCGMPIPLAEEIDESGELAPPPAYRLANLKSYPWSEPVVFRAGRYLVHRDLQHTEESQQISE